MRHKRRLFVGPYSRWPRKRAYRWRKATLWNSLSRHRFYVDHLPLKELTKRTLMVVQKVRYLTAQEQRIFSSALRRSVKVVHVGALLL
jgi:hypothetical protein